jgi:hypothetical protein
LVVALLARPWRTASALLAGLVMGACAATTPHWPVQLVQLAAAGATVATTVDSSLAQRFAQAEFGAPGAANALPAELAGVLAALGDRLPSAAEITTLSKQYSPDLATLVLQRQISRSGSADPVLARYRAELAAPVPAANTLRAHLFVLVPGWLHQADPTSGADLSRQALVLKRLGAQVYRPAMPENASVEDNAARLVHELQVLSQQHASIVLVSASKGGAEAALALSVLAEQPAGEHIAAWVNIGGTLKGTPLADLATSWPACWFVQAAVLPDASFDGLRSLEVAHSTRRHAALKWPRQLLVVNVIGLPLSGQVSPRARQSYALLRPYGANDGIMLLADVVDAAAPGSTHIALLGTDHFFQVPDIDRHTAAIAQAVVSQLARRGAGAT